MRRLLIVLGVVALLAAACDAGGAETTTTGSTSSSTTSTTSSTTTTTTEPPRPVTPQTCAEAGDYYGPEQGAWFSSEPGMAFCDRVFYEVFVRSFADSNGDGIGDLKGLTEHLDYLNDGDPNTHDDLGITGIWLMPIFESPSYHGYDVTDYLRIEPDYGTLEDFEAFLAAAHERGISVIIDLVLNHTSRQHPWFAQSYLGNPEYADWYIWSDTDPGYLGPDGQQVWYQIGDRWYYALFWEGMPDLNLTNPDVTAEMYSIADYWLDEGVDGFRLDAAKHLIEAGQRQENTAQTLQWLTDFKTEVDGVDPNALVVGEVWDSTVISAAYVPDAVDLTFEFDLASAILLAIDAGNTSPIVSTMEDIAKDYPPGQYAAFLSNHDQERVMSRLNTVEKAKLAALLLLTNPGMPFIYYGEEVGLTGNKPDERIRTPMPWTADDPGVGFTTGTPWEDPNPGYQTANVADESSDPDSLLSWYRDLIRLRSEHPALRFGDYLPVETGSNAAYAFVRTIGDDHLLVIANLSRLPVSSYALDLAAGPFEGSVDVSPLIGPEVTGQIAATGAGGFAGYVPVPELQPRQVLVLSLGGD